MRMKTKRILCMALSVVMLLGVIPVQALAVTADTGGMLAPQQVSDSAVETPPDPESTPGLSADPDAAPPTEEPPAEDADPGTEPPREAEGNPKEEPPAGPTIGESGKETPPEEPPEGDAPVHWLQQYQKAALEASQRPMARSARAATGSPSYSMIEWSGGNLAFASGAYMGSPMPKIYLDGEIAFCAEWNGQQPSGDYTPSGEGSNPVIKQILANYNNSGKSNADYAAAQAAIWAHIMGTSVSSWGG